jgi:tetratricopeptide (TPR) repeat protein
MAVLEGTSDPDGIDEVNRSLGWIHWLKGDYKKAVGYYNKVIAKKPKDSDQSARGKIYINLGNIFWEKGNYTKAIDYYNKSLKIFESLKDFQRMALVHNYLGCLHVDMKEFDKALEFFNQTLDICSNINFIRCEGYVYLHLAQLWLNKKDPDNCISNLEKAVKIFEKIDDKFGLSYGKVNYGLNFIIDNNYSDAIIPFNDAIELLKKLDLPFYLAEVYLGNALIYEKMDKAENLIEYKRMANQILKVLSDIQ